MAEAMVAAEALVERVRARPGRARMRVRGEPASSRRDRRRPRHPRRGRSRARAGDHGRVRDRCPRSSRSSARATRRRSVVLEGGMQADLRVVPQDVVGRGAPVLHRLEGPQRRDAHDRREEEAQGERVRRLRRERREASPARPRQTVYEAIGLALDAARAAREPRRDRGRDRRTRCRSSSSSPTCAAISTCTRPRPTGKSSARADGRGRARGGSLLRRHHRPLRDAHVRARA